MTTNFNLTVQTKNKLLKIIFNKTNQPNTSLKIILALHLILHILDICFLAHRTSSYLFNFSHNKKQDLHPAFYFNHFITNNF